MAIVSLSETPKSFSTAIEFRYRLHKFATITVIYTYFGYRTSSTQRADELIKPSDVTTNIRIIQDNTQYFPPTWKKSGSVEEELIRVYEIVGHGEFKRITDYEPYAPVFSMFRELLRDELVTHHQYLGNDLDYFLEYLLSYTNAHSDVVVVAKDFLTTERVVLVDYKVIDGYKCAISINITLSQPSTEEDPLLQKKLLVRATLRWERDRKKDTSFLTLDIHPI